MYGTTLNRASLLILSILLMASQQAAAQAGQLDSTFGTSGIFATNFTEDNFAPIDNALAIQSDGKIVLGGATPNGPALLRLNTNGTLDPSFGSGGIVTNTFGGDVADVFAVAIQPDGKILAAAQGFSGPIGRFNSDGSLDTTFGNGGIASSMSLFTAIGTPNAFALQADGKILITGSGLVGRYTSTGQLDPSFGTNGIAPLNAAAATAMVVLPSGQILMTTGSGAPSLISVGAGVSFNLPIPQAGAIARYNANGSLDTTFGISGQAACPASAAGFAVQSNGKIVVAGTITSALLTAPGNGGTVVINNQTGFGLVRYNANGSIDTTFNPGIGIGAGGGVITGFGNTFPNGGAFALAIQSNGAIVVAGVAGVPGVPNALGTNFSSSSLVLARYTTTGHLDNTFGTNGIVSTSVTPGPISFVSALVLQSDGKIVAAGNTGFYDGLEFFDNFAVARYLAQ